MIRWLLLLALLDATALFASTGIPPECLAEMVAEMGPSGDELGETPSLDALNPVALTTERLTLATPRRSDLPELLPIFRHGPTVRFTWFDWGEGFWSLRRVGVRYDTFAKKALAGERHDFLIRRREDGVLIGRMALYRGETPGSLEMGITLHEPYWGNRYAPEVITEIFRYAFRDLKATELRFRTEPENEKMLKQYERLGIPKVRDASEDLHPEPPFFHRYHHFALTRDAWCARHGCP